MKTVIADYRYRVQCMRIVPISGSTIRLTDHLHDLDFGATIYSSTNGYQFTGYSSTEGFSPSSIDLEGIVSASGISRATVASGGLDGARVYIFATSWLTPVEDEEPITAGIFGKTELRDHRFRVSLLSLSDALSQSIGLLYQAQCPKVFLGQEYAGCMVPVSPNTVTGTLTHVTNAGQFRDSTRAEAADTFGAGTLAFTTGPNAGLTKIEIRAHAADGTITLMEPFYYLPAVGNAYTMTRGCRKRLIDCKSRMGNTGLFNNVENFGGDLWIPTNSVYTQRGTFGK